MIHRAACRRAWRSPRLASVTRRSATGRTALARALVVWTRPCSNRLVTRFRVIATRCAASRPRRLPFLRCRMLLLLAARVAAVFLGVELERDVGQAAELLLVEQLVLAGAGLADRHAEVQAVAAQDLGDLGERL